MQVYLSKNKSTKKQQRLALCWQLAAFYQHPPNIVLNYQICPNIYLDKPEGDRLIFSTQVSKKNILLTSDGISSQIPKIFVSTTLSVWNL